MNIHKKSLTLGDKTLHIQIGKLAQAADVSILGRLGDTCVLVTVVAGRERPDLGYFPLGVEYVEKLYAGGRIKGSRWVKREGRPSDEAILTARLIDRSIRPLFHKSYKKEVQVVATLLSIDGINSPDIVSAIATSLALHLSSIPWKGPIGTIRIGYVKENGDEEGTFVVNPDEQDQKFSRLDLVVSSREEKVVMIEAKGEIVPEKIIIEAIEKAKEENKKIIQFIEDIRKEIGKPKEKNHEGEKSDEIMDVLRKKYAHHLDRIMLKKGGKEKDDEDDLELIIEEIYKEFEDTYTKKEIAETITQFTHQKIREGILKDKKRIDGRGPDEIRPLTVENSVLPRTHGSALFQRGSTQVLSIATLGSPTLEQLIESPEGEAAKRYLHHYYMPPYSVGETGRLGSPSRREIGHGALAEKAIEPVLPSQEKFPYAIRVVSEVLSSNGSTSMAATCGSSLALMDAGVPITAAVAGISIGLVSKSDDEYVLLTDISGIEDFAGEMDFKIAGCEKGVTAIQLDVKNAGLTSRMIIETFEKAHKARLHILEKMNAIIKKPRGELSQYAPKVVVLTPPPDKIGEIIGPGGKNIKQIIAKTQTQVDVSDDGKVSITGIDRTMVDEAVKLINNVYRKIDVGETFTGEVKRIMPFGAFVEFLPGKEGLVHVSRMGRGYVKDPHEVVKIGQKVSVRVYQIDNQGRTNLEMGKESPPSA
ncbi:MAG TPA: polyribonucleotide nucleotidyltransferase [Patescibacteria group bacterium]|nr:polyribonucleotide nucleotidyltransferase [Patescibacteria group bacterium]